MKKYLVFILLLLSMTCLWGCANQSAEVPELLEPVGVNPDTAVVAYDEISKSTVYNAQVIPYVEEVHFKIDGNLEEYKVALGEEVEAGQILVTLDDEAIRERIKSLEEQILNTITLGEFSDRTMELDIQIARENLLKQKEYYAKEEKIEEAQIQLEMEEAKLRQSKELRQLTLDRLYALLEEEKQNLEETTLQAPINGVVVYRYEIAHNDFVEGFTPMICIADHSQLSILSDYISDLDIKNAQRIYTRIGKKEYDVTYVPYESEDYISMVLSGDTMSTKFTVNDSSAELENGQYAAVIVESYYKDNVLTIPINALNQDQIGKYVYKIVDGQHIRCDVKVAMETDVKAEISEGLEEGDVVYVKN